MLRAFLLREAVHSTALSCGCGSCVACRASNGDEAAWVEVLAALQDAETRRDSTASDGGGTVASP